jgi:hypothetical protein
LSGATHAHSRAHAEVSPASDDSNARSTIRRFITV